MQIGEKTINGAGREVVRFTLGKDEAELILGSMIASYRNFPVIEKWKPDARRMKTIIRSLKKVVEDSK